MKAVILAGGRGTRIEEESQYKPKPMVEIGGKPIIWHIMKIYSHYNIKNFIICCGYKGYLIKEYFVNYFLHNSDIEVKIKENQVKLFNREEEDWNIILADTGLDTATAGRLKKVEQYLLEDENFCFTYGDGLADIKIDEKINFHLNHKKNLTLSAVQLPGRYGSLEIHNNEVKKFLEKPTGDNLTINGGFFVLRKEIFKYIRSYNEIGEEDTLPRIVMDNQAMAYTHNGFFGSMDSLRDKNQLNNLWNSNLAKWKMWK